MIETDSLVYFMPLFYSSNPWMMDETDMKHIEPLSVKVTAYPGEFRDLIVEEVDVFTVEGYMPPYPKTKVSQALLMDSIRGALAIKADMDVRPFNWSIVIYGGK